MSIPFIKSPNYTAGRLGPILWIVIHDMEAPEAGTTAESVAHYFQQTAAQSSAHYNVDNNSVVQCVRDADTAWHAPYANAKGLGIEHAGYASQRRPQWLDDFSAAELAVSAKLTAGLAKKYSIPVVRLTPAEMRANKKGFVGHIDATNAFLNGQGHTDPGPNFPWDVYLKMVQAELDALNGKKWTKSKIAAAAAACVVALAVFAGVSQTSDPAPAPKPAATKTVQTPNAAPTKAPVKKPVTPAKPTSKPAPKFALPKGHWYGSETSNPKNHSGYYSADRAAIKVIQSKLGTTADGRFGPGTKAKVVAWQKAHHLAGDGRVGPYGWSVLAR